MDTLITVWFFISTSILALIIFAFLKRLFKHV